MGITCMRQKMHGRNISIVWGNLLRRQMLLRRNNFWFEWIQLDQWWLMCPSAYVTCPLFDHGVLNIYNATLDKWPCLNEIPLGGSETDWDMNPIILTGDLESPSNTKILKENRGIASVNVDRGGGVVPLPSCDDTSHTVFWTLGVHFTVVTPICGQYTT